MLLRKVPMLANWVASFQAVESSLSSWRQWSTSAWALASQPLLCHNTRQALLEAKHKARLWATWAS
eukprot:6384792-Lingulodinium_polyedra.AAC.1